MFNAGETLAAPLCAEGSTMDITVSPSVGTPALLRCWRRTGNANACQRLW